MDNFSEIKNQYSGFKNEFDSNIKDNFGNSIQNEGLEPILNHLNILEIQEQKIQAEIVVIQTILTQARAILPDMGA
jgi:hypothetical protein